MRFISWNVNGLRSCVQKGFMDFFNGIDADFVCLQETKLQPEQISLDTPGYEQYWFSAEKKGYSGTAIFAKHKPISVVNGIGDHKYDCEGRCITLEYEDFYLVTCYTPNSQDGLKRLDYRLDWERDLRLYGSLGHGLRFAAENLGCQRVFIGAAHEQGLALCVLIYQRLGAYHLGIGQGCAQLPAYCAEAAVGYACHGGEDQLVFDFYVSYLYHVKSSPTGQWSEPSISLQMYALEMLSLSLSETMK